MFNIAVLRILVRQAAVSLTWLPVMRGKSVLYYIVSLFKKNGILYTLFQNGCHFSVLLFACKLALVA